MTSYRKRRLSKIPAPVIIPPRSPITNAPSPISSAKSDSFLELPSPKTPRSPTKKFILKPISAITAAFQRTSRKSSTATTFLKFQKSPKSPKPTSPRTTSSQSPKSPKSPKFLHRKGSNGSIRKHSENSTDSVANAPPFFSSNVNQSQTNNSKKPFPAIPKPPSKLRKFKPQKSCSRKASPMIPSELAERLRESSSRSAKIEEEFSHRLHKSIILIDVRNLALYQDKHIRGSFNVNLPTLLIKRYRRGNMSNFSLDSFITTPEGREKYLNINEVNENGDQYHHDVIIFDESMDETNKDGPGWTLLSVLERTMLNFSSDNVEEINEVSRGRVYWLRGGFEAFRLWDQKDEFIVTGLEVGFLSDKDSVDSNLSECESQEQQQGSGLVRRDSLFSVNTERNSLRRKQSGKQPELKQGQNTQQPLPLEINVGSKQVEVSRGRRPSNGLQYLFPTNGNSKISESLLYYSTSHDIHNFSTAVTTKYSEFEPVSPNTPTFVTHPEISFVISTIIPEFLFIGPEVTKEEEVKELKEKGIKRILNMAFECEDFLGLKEKFDCYLKLNVKDSVEEDVERGLKAAVDFIERAQEDKMPIYVHCKAGRSRSVTAVLAYLIKSRQWTLRQAYDYVTERRSSICPNIGFVAELMRVEEGVFGFKESRGALTEYDIRKKEEMFDMEGIEPLSKIPKTAFF